MRGSGDFQGHVFVYIQPESMIPVNHPLRTIKKYADALLRRLSPEFDKHYSNVGRPSVPPEQLLKATLLIALYTVRSDRLFCEMLSYNILFRWFLDLNFDGKTLDPSNFSRLRARLVETDLARRFFDSIVSTADEKGLLSDEHFTVDGSLIEAWASHKSFVPKKDEGSDTSTQTGGSQTTDSPGQSKPFGSQAADGLDPSTQPSEQQEAGEATDPIQTADRTTEPQMSADGLGHEPDESQADEGLPIDQSQGGEAGAAPPAAESSGQSQRATDEAHLLQTMSQDQSMADPRRLGKDEMIDFRGQKRTNDTHHSTTDPEARLMRKGPGKEAKLSFGGHALMENRNGFLIDIVISPATETEPTIAKDLLTRAVDLGFNPKTLGADKGYHTKDFVKWLRDQGIAPHIARIAGRRTPGLDGRTTRHDSYKVSQRVRKRVEEIFGWSKSVGGFRKTRLLGVVKNQFAAYMVGAAYNLVRLSRLALT